MINYEYPINYVRLDHINNKPLLSIGYEDENGKCSSRDIVTHVNSFEFALQKAIRLAESLSCKLVVFMRNQEFQGINL